MQVAELVHSSEQAILSDFRRNDPTFKLFSNRLWNWNGADMISLADQVDNGPAAFPLFQIA